MDSLSHCLQGFMHPRCRISFINSSFWWKRYPFYFCSLVVVFFSPWQQCHEFSLHIGWFVWSEQKCAKLALGSKYLDLRDFFLPDLPDHLKQHFAKAQYTQDMQSYLLRFGALGMFLGFEYQTSAGGTGCLGIYTPRQKTLPKSKRKPDRLC